MGKSGEAAALEDARIVGNGEVVVGDVGHEDLGIAPPPSLQRASLPSSSKLKLKEVLTKIRLRKRSAASTSVSRNIDNGFVDSRPSTGLALAVSDADPDAVAGVDVKVKEKVPSPPHAPSLPPPSQSRALRDHVAKFTKRSNALGAFVVLETAFWWGLTAVAPTLFERHRCFVASSSFSSSSSTPSSSFFSSPSSPSPSSSSSFFSSPSSPSSSPSSSSSSSSSSSTMATAMNMTTAAEGITSISTPSYLAIAATLFPPLLPSFLFYAAWGVARALAYVRTVILMHDLVHGVVFTNRKVNAFCADVAGLAAWTSARDFRSNHGRHHARLGVEEEVDYDADHTIFWTRREWEQEWEPGTSKLLARFFRDPVVYHLFSAPAYLLFFGSTHPGFGPGVPFSKTVVRLFKEQWLRVVGVVAGFSAIAVFVSYDRFVQELAAGWLGLICGASIFALQHDAVAPPLKGYRAPSSSHSRDTAALKGSTYVPVPEWLSKRVTLGIEFHHIHHLDARVPCYRLYECHHSLASSGPSLPPSPSPSPSSSSLSSSSSSPSSPASSPPSPWEEAGVPVLRGWRDILRGLSMALYDEDTGEFAPFPSPLVPTLKPGQAREWAMKAAEEARKGFVRLREGL